MTDMIFSRQDLEAALATRMRGDPTVRQEVLADPRAAIARQTGQTLPADITVRVHEETAAVLHLVVRTDGALGDADLDGVSGGISSAALRRARRQP